MVRHLLAFDPRNGGELGCQTSWDVASNTIAPYVIIIGENELLIAVNRGERD